MSAAHTPDFHVALVAADAAGIAALRPATEILNRFGLSWSETVVPAGSSMSFDGEGLRAIIVASPDAVLPAALAAGHRHPVIRVPTFAHGREGTGPLVDPTTQNLPAPAADAPPFATVAIGEAGARNAALFVVCCAGLRDTRIWAEWLAFRQQQTDAVLGHAPLENI